jgi:hypothetical protein
MTNKERTAKIAAALLSIEQVRGEMPTNELEGQILEAAMTVLTKYGLQSLEAAKADAERERAVFIAGLFSKN